MQGLDRDAALQDVLSRYWGYNAFRPLQREAMEAILEGRDSVTVLPTGGGKSLCFQAPALLMDGLAVVVSPLISLMKDQVDTLTGNGVPAALFNSSLSSGDKAAVASGLRAGRYRLLYVSPERLVGEGSETFVGLLSTCRPRFVAVDEAHCISQWGHDFRPEYRQLGRLRQLLPGVSLHAFTATATTRVRRDISTELALRDPLELVGSFDRPNLLYRALPRGTLKRQLLEVLDRRRGEAGIIYCTSRREVDALAAWLTGTGVPALPYHAGLSDAERSINQDAFLSERVNVIVATVAFGMGIDRSDVRFVVHAGAPRSLEHYQQESGRAGRDGLEAECTLIYSSADFMKWRLMLERNGELTDAAVGLLRQMERYASNVGCRHKHLAEYFGDRYSQRRCGACDVCLDELEAAPEPVVLARKILSCVVRVGQRFGATHVASVLRGHASEPVRARRHDALSTFGLLPEASVAEVRGYIDQLVGLDLLRSSGEEYPVLVVTSKGVELLKNAESCPDLRLARQRRPRKGEPRTRSRAEAASWEGVDGALFERLRAVRLDVARSRGVPPYVIFHDVTLREMARLRPTTIDALLTVRGVGARKADDLGDIFLAAIRAHHAADLQGPPRV
ncbi:MAG TPA: DNA helicase RecQ [Vicinamibacterales bacterium]|nr:DNA helicase RecQ [Vicinamibacterales bacterium]